MSVDRTSVSESPATPTPVPVVASTETEESSSKFKLPESEPTQLPNQHQPRNSKENSTQITNTNPPTQPEPEPQQHLVPNSYATVGPNAKNPTECLLVGGFGGFYTYRVPGSGENCPKPQNKCVGSRSCRKLDCRPPWNPYTSGNNCRPSEGCRALPLAAHGQGYCRAPVHNCRPHCPLHPMLSCGPQLMVIGHNRPVPEIPSLTHFNQIRELNIPGAKLFEGDFKCAVPEPNCAPVKCRKPKRRSCTRFRKSLTDALRSCTQTFPSTRDDCCSSNNLAQRRTNDAACGPAPHCEEQKHKQYCLLPSSYCTQTESVPRAGRRLLKQNCETQTVGRRKNFYCQTEQECRPKDFCCQTDAYESASRSGLPNARLPPRQYRVPVRQIPNCPPKPECVLVCPPKPRQPTLTCPPTSPPPPRQHHNWHKDCIPRPEECLPRPPTPGKAPHPPKPTSPSPPPKGPTFKPTSPPPKDNGPTEPVPKPISPPPEESEVPPTPGTLPPAKSAPLPPSSSPGSEPPKSAPSLQAIITSVPEEVPPAIEMMPVEINAQAFANEPPTQIILPQIPEIKEIEILQPHLSEIRLPDPPSVPRMTTPEQPADLSSPSPSGAQLLGPPLETTPPPSPPEVNDLPPATDTVVPSQSEPPSTPAELPPAENDPPSKPKPVTSPPPTAEVPSVPTIEILPVEINVHAFAIEQPDPIMPLLMPEITLDEIPTPHLSEIRLPSPPSVPRMITPPQEEPSSPADPPRSPPGQSGDEPSPPRSEPSLPPPRNEPPFFPSRVALPPGPAPSLPTVTEVRSRIEDVPVEMNVQTSATGPEPPGKCPPSPDPRRHRPHHRRRHADCRPEPECLPRPPVCLPHPPSGHEPVAGSRQQSLLPVQLYFNPHTMTLYASTNITSPIPISAIQTVTEICPVPVLPSECCPPREHRCPSTCRRHSRHRRDRC